MITTLIVAKSKNNAIGRDNDMPWRLSADLKYFKKNTTGHYIIMGRKTFDSIGRPLPKRTNIIITRNKDYQQEGCVVLHSLEEAIQYAQQNEQEEAFIIGGAQIYKQAVDLVDKMLITEVDAVIEDADAFFPEMDMTVWSETHRESHKADEKNNYDCDFVSYIKK